MSISKDDITRVKGRGFLLNRGTECFSGRVVPVAGAFSAADLKSIAECAEMVKQNPRHEKDLYE